MKIERILKNPDHDGKDRRPHGVKVSFDEWPNVNAPNAPKAPAATYHFLPVDDSPGAPWVADVDNAVHAARLLSISEGYQQYTADGKKPASTASLPAPPTVGATAPSAPPMQAASVQAESADPARVAEIREMPIRDLKAKINTYTDGEVKAALDLEQAEKSPRKGLVDVLSAQLAAPTK